MLRWLLERKLSLSLLIEFTQMRLAFEPIAAGLAALAAGPAEKATVMAAIDRMIASERGEDDPLSSDIAFHVSIIRASGNRFYSQLSELIETALRFSIRTTNYFKGVRLASVVDHKVVADAIMACDAQTAETAMRKMMQEALDLIRSAEAADNDVPRPRKRVTTR